mgnify:CR=1 FL=1
MRRAIYKQNGLSGTSPSGYKYVGFDVDTFSEITGTTVSAIGGSSKNYIEYVGLLSQSGTNAPTLITLVNEILHLSKARFFCFEYGYFFNSLKQSPSHSSSFT